MVNVAIYVRLSDEDRDKQHETDESESIGNQKAMLSDYCKERNWEIFDIYCDEDYSGIDRNRPDFKRMLTDCEKGCIDIVLCKSQSRFSRDMEVIEKYIHNKFLEWNVRFISVVDRADSFDAANKKARQINGLINEWYLEDTSENIRKTLQSKRQRGEFTGSFAVYGYSVDPNNKNRLIIDEYAAPVIRDIFNWYIQGWGYRKISMKLNELGIPNPTLHKQRQDSKYVNSNANKSAAKNLWTQSTVYSIIRNETYTGALIQGKCHFVSYKNKKRKNVPKEEWIKVKGCHESIIDETTWTKTQKKLNEKTRACKTTQELAPLSGKVKCAVCGTAMKRNIYYNRKRTIQYYNLICGTIAKGAMNCSNKASISGLQLDAVLLRQINEWIKDYCNRDEVKILSEHEIKLKLIYSEAEAINSAKEKIESKVNGLYEDKLSGVITKEQFISFSRRYEKETAELEEKLKNIERQAEFLHKLCSDNEHRKELIEKYSCINRLTRLIADEFISMVYIGEKAEGQEREVTVHWKF